MDNQETGRDSRFSAWIVRLSICFPSLGFAVAVLVCFVQGRYRVAADHFHWGALGPWMILVCQLALAFVLLLVFCSPIRRKSGPIVIVAAMFCGSAFALPASPTFAGEFWFRFGVGFLMLLFSVPVLFGAVRLDSPSQMRR